MTLPLTIVQEKHEEKIILRLDGRIDGNTSHILEKKLEEVLSKEQYVLLDFTQVDYMSTAGLRVLLAGTKKHKDLYAKGHLILFSLSKELRDMVHVAGFDKIFRITENQQSALQID